MDTSYQNSARRFRPQRFDEVIGQDAVIKTLKNAFLFQRVSHAYLFSGGRGSGKTTIARLFAKLLNCLEGKEEPCNACQNCREISLGTSLDVIEIDGASNRGIDDMRNINENTHYTPSFCKYKIYIIDEVHMLTKEAFNALLKTLEEPPPKVKFFFATTEPHKVLPTILSRCQRFDLKRIQTKDIIKKLDLICTDMEREREEKALEKIASFADGSLRDAESFLDQVFCFEEGKITEKGVSSLLGLTHSEEFLKLDAAIHQADLSFAFPFVEKLYQEGKDLFHFLEELLTHFRSHLEGLITGKHPFPTTASYQKEQLLFILDQISEIKPYKIAVKRVHVEMLLLKVLRSKLRVSIESILQKLQKDPPPPKEEPAFVPVPFAEKAPIEKKEEAVGKTKASLDTLFRFAQVELKGALKYF